MTIFSRCFETLSDLLNQDAKQDYDLNTVVLVYGDPVPTRCGYWAKLRDGGWYRVGDLRRDPREVFAAWLLAGTVVALGLGLIGMLLWMAIDPPPGW